VDFTWDRPQIVIFFAYLFVFLAWQCQLYCWKGC